MADLKTTIFFLCEGSDGSSPPNPVVHDIVREIIEPAVPFELEYHLVTGSFRDEPGMTEHFIQLMAQVDLVIADLTDLTPTGHFLLGARKQVGLPIIYMCDLGFDGFPSHIMTEKVVWYSMADLVQARAGLAAEIISTLSALDVDPIPGTRARRLELAERIEETAEIIRGLRINSAGESVQSLIEIANELRAASDDSPSFLRRAADKALDVINSVLDELSSQAGARMAITAAVSLIVGGTGVPGAAAFGAGLAFWYGPDAFRNWLNRRHKD